MCRKLNTYLYLKAIRYLFRSIALLGFYKLVTYYIGIIGNGNGR